MKIKALCAILFGWRVFTAFFAKPNAVFILTDDQGYDATAHGHPYLKTPTNRLPESVSFDNFYRQSSCSPTRAAP